MLVAVWTIIFDYLKHKIFSYFHHSTKIKIKSIKMATSQRITSVTNKSSDVMVKISNRDPHTMPLGELYRLTGGWDGVREALGITMWNLSYKDKCEKIRRENAEKQAKMEAEWRILVVRGRKKNAESSARYASEHEALLAAKRSAKRLADEWGKLFFN